MLKSTFCHVPLISIDTEAQIWKLGVRSWDQIHLLDARPLTSARMTNLRRHLALSAKHLEAANPLFFAGLLPTSEHWRLFKDFRESTAYVDIETTGLGFPPACEITTIALYDGNKVRFYVRGENLRDFPSDIREYKTIVTYNGKLFDVPFIERTFKIKLKVAHIDLRFVLASLGFTGGLKRCERRFKIDRGDLNGIDGLLAVFLWKEYRKHRDYKALETLLAYNIQDAIILEDLMVRAFNMKLKRTPFLREYELPSPTPPQPFFHAYPETLSRIWQLYGIYLWGPPPRWLDLNSLQRS